MKRALFVDDEKGLLDGLRGRLRALRSEWEMKFVDNADAAIAELSRTPCELVVSDIRMPGTDGVQLLTQVSERWPAAMRVALSGYANQEQTLRLIPVAHQYLSKPCAAGVLEAVLARCAYLQKVLPVAKLRAMVGGVRQLAPTPGAAARMLEALERPNCTAAEIANLVSADTVIAGKVLQVANSAFFRHGHSVSRIEQAVGYLGLSEIKILIGAHDVFHQPLGAQRPPEFDLTMLQVQANAMAASVAKSGLTGNSADEAFAAALLQNIGYWVLVQEASAELAVAAEHARREGVAMHIAEVATLGASHAEVGAYLLGLWGLPDAVIDNVLNHHRGEMNWLDTTMVQSLKATQHHAIPAPAHSVDATRRR